MRVGRLHPSTAPQPKHLQTKPHREEASTGTWMGAGGPWGCSTQVLLVVQWMTESSMGSGAPWLWQEADDCGFTPWRGSPRGF